MRMRGGTMVWYVRGRAMGTRQTDAGVVLRYECDYEIEIEMGWIGLGWNGIVHSEEAKQESAETECG